MGNTIYKKLAAGFGICVLLMAVLIGFHLSTLQRLEKLYHETFKRSVEMELATDAQHIGEDLYLVIANAVINRNMAKTESDWAAAKIENRKKLLLVTAAADSPLEIVKVKEATAAFGGIIDIFEHEMLPLIKAGATVPGPLADIDARIEAKIEAIDLSLQVVAHSMSADNSRASRDFHGVLSDNIKLGLLFSLLVVLAALHISAVTTRKIVRPLAEITGAAREIERGNYRFELLHRSDDETGVLANAFRSMMERVTRHTVELEQSNLRLNAEVRERKLAEAEVGRLNANLERRVEERTMELMLTNEQCLMVIRAQREAEDELRRSRTELRRLSQHLQEAREAERTSVAREIHDELGQLLTALKIELAWLGKSLPEEQRGLLEKTGEISRHIDATIKTVQRISAELRPGILDDLGLAAALQWQAQEFQKKTDINCEVQSSFDCSKLDRRQSTALFRIFQETLTNIYRHAEATSATVTLQQRGDTLVATVIDNGKGVSTKKITGPKSLGFVGMRERVRPLGGEVTVSRMAEGGTLVQVILPLGRPAGESADPADYDSRIENSNRPEAPHKEHSEV
jgi:signal transduction histidine kinase